MQTKVKQKLTAIGKYEYFKNAIKQLTLDKELENEQQIYILSSAILFLKEFEKDRELLSYADLAYYIILKYSLNTGDYKPLYDFSVNFGFYPISRIILDNNLLSSLSIEDYLIDSRLDDFKHEKGYVETFDQYNERSNFINDFSFEKSYIAPTSFGKSSVIVDYIKSFKEYHSLKIVIVVPTKSLLMQTYKMIRDTKLFSKLIIHDDMHNKDDSFIAIFTQERALRLLKKGIFYDVIIIDEAHLIFEKDRGILISRLIRKNSLLNLNQKIIYLSPLVKDTENLKITSKQNISNHHIKFNLKEPEFFEFKTKSSEVYQYNRFVNKYYKIKSDAKLDTFAYIKLNSADKNFLFENSPQKIENLAKEFCESDLINKINHKEEIVNLKEILSKRVHEEYFAIKYLDYGLVYIHGQLPNLIKEYLEYKFKTLNSLRYIIANTVILEGINLPINTLFIFGARMISNGKSLLNLVGRVNRFDKIFEGYRKENLPMLLPKVHIISDKENGHDSKFNYLRSRVFDDIIKNPMLELYDIDKVGPSKNKKEERNRFIERIKKIQVYEDFIYSKITSEQDKVKKYFVENNINNYYKDADIAINFFLIKKKRILSKKQEYWKDLSMMGKIADIFIQDEDNIYDYEFKRLVHQATQKYYEGYFTVAMKQNLKINIEWQVKKFNEIKSDNNINQKKIYIGESYGDTTWTFQDSQDSKREVYVNLLDKSQEELINIAIVKLQIEEKFVSFTLNKFIRALFDFKLITEEDFNIYTYGTNDIKKIKFHKQGLNLNLINRLLDDGQLKNISTDSYNNLKGNSKFKKFLETIDDFYKFEIGRYIN